MPTNGTQRFPESLGEEEPSHEVKGLPNRLSLPSTTSDDEAMTTGGDNDTSVQSQSERSESVAGNEGGSKEKRGESPMTLKA